LAQAESDYYRSLVNYVKSISQVHFQKGSLLEYNGIFLAEGPWPGKAYFDARRRARARDASRYLDYGFTMPKVVSRGPYKQFDNDSATAEKIPTIAPAKEGSPINESPAKTPEKPAGTVEPIPSPEPETSLPKAPEPLEPAAPTKSGADGEALPGATSGSALETPSRRATSQTRPAQRHDLGLLDLSALAGKPSSSLSGGFSPSQDVKQADFQQSRASDAAAPAATGWKGIQP
jgi:hypothetical protein